MMKDERRKHLFANEKISVFSRIKGKRKKEKRKYNCENKEKTDYQIIVQVIAELVRRETAHPTALPMLNIGRYIATIIVPTIPPITIMRIGSIMLVRPSTATSTSSS